MVNSVAYFMDPPDTVKERVRIVLFASDNYCQGRCAVYLRVRGADEIELVAVWIADAELPGAVEHVLDVLLEYDALVPSGLARERDPCGLELTRFEQLIERVDLVRV